MAGITLETAQRMLDVWVAAEESVSHGQSYQIGNRSLTKADLTQIGKRIEYWSNKVTELSQQRKGRNRMGHVALLAEGVDRNSIEKSPRRV